MIMVRKEDQIGAVDTLGILVVDDENLVRRVISRRFQMDGFRVWEARDGAEAVELYRLFQDEIDGVLLDVCMPGLDGRQTLEEIRALNPNVVACFLTGYADDYSDDELLEAGASHVYIKTRVDWEILMDFFRDAARNE
jgi:CheY-like chemotaxis protein